MAKPAKPSWLPVGGLLVGVVAGVLFWFVRVQAVDQEIESKRTALKKLHVGERIPPNQEVTDYLTRRTEALETQYRAALALLTIPSVVEGQADPQLFFQQRVHDVGRTIERLATARGMTTPEQLGFPKELPPADAVPRFLIQLGLIEDVAERTIAIVGLSQLQSFRVDDPQVVTPSGANQESFLTRLPVRVRLSCSLEALPKILVTLDRARPLMDLQDLRVASSATSQQFDVEIVLARYLLSAPSFAQPKEDTGQPPAASRPKKRS